MKNMFKSAIFAALAAFVGAQAATTYGPVTLDTIKTTIQHGGVDKDTNLVRATFDGTSDETLNLPEDIVVSQIVIRRKFVAGKPQTMMLPFDLPESWRSAPLRFWRYVGMQRHGKGDWQFRTNAYSGTIEANTPFVVLSNSDADSIMFNMNWMAGQQYGNVTLNSTKGGNKVVNYENWKFVGTYERIDWEKGHPDLGCVYGFSAKNKDGIQIGQFVKAAVSDSSHPYVRGMRAYLHYSPAVAAKRAAFASADDEFASISTENLPATIEVVFEEDDGTSFTGRMNTATGEIAVDKWFDLKGRKLQHKPTVKGSYYNNGHKVVIK